MDTNEKRNIISLVYPSNGWKSRVKKMSEKQVHAIYMRLLEEGKLKGIVK